MILKAYYLKAISLDKLGKYEEAEKAISKSSGWL